MIWDHEPASSPVMKRRRIYCRESEAHTHTHKKEAGIQQTEGEGGAHEYKTNMRSGSVRLTDYETVHITT